MDSPNLNKLPNRQILSNCQKLPRPNIHPEPRVPGGQFISYGDGKWIYSSNIDGGSRFESEFMLTLYCINVSSPSTTPKGRARLLLSPPACGQHGMKLIFFIKGRDQISIQITVSGTVRMWDCIPSIFSSMWFSCWKSARSQSRNREVSFWGRFQ